MYDKKHLLTFEDNPTIITKGNQISLRVLQSRPQYELHYNYVLYMLYVAIALRHD